MEIRLNGSRTPVTAAATIGDLIRQKGLDPSTVVVEHNQTIIAADDLDRIALKDDDRLEILRFVGGG